MRLSVFRVLSVEEGFLLLLPPPPCNTSTKTSRRSCRVCQSKNWSRSLERAEPMETESLRQTLLGDSCPDQPVHRSQLCKQLALLRDLAVRALAAGPATNSIFFCFLFCEKSLICLAGKSMTPHRGNTILFRSSQQLPRLRLRPLKGF